MSYVLGIDIGTSFTAAAITRLGNDDSPAPQTLNLGLHTSAVPSVIFTADDGHVVVGEAAERRGINFPDRVVREFKRRIGDTVPIVAGDLCVNAEDIFAVMARWVADRAEGREGEPPEAVTISHPAGWGEYKTGLIRHALAGVGLADVTLLSEPEAAALHYGSQERVDPGSTIAVYDLGGGTFDAALLRKTSEQAFEPRGRPAGIDRLGGADFDEAVFRHVAASMGDTFGQLDVSDPAVLLALSRVRRECREAKEALSSDSEATIPVLLPEAHSQIRLVRSEFEAMIDAPVRQTVETLAGALESARLEANDLSVILLIGGSSRIPLVAQLLSDQLDRPIAVDADPKSSICLGAAYAAAAQVRAAAAEAAGDGGGPRGAGAEPDGERAGAADDPAAAAHHESEAHAALFLASAAGRHKNKQSHNGARIAAIAAGALILTGLTAAAAKGPSGFLGPLTSLSAQQPDSGDAQGSHQDGKREHDAGSAAGNGGGAAYGDADAVSGANSRADAAATARAEDATADGGVGADGGADGDGGGGGGGGGSQAGNDSGTTTADASGDSSPKSSSPAKDRNNTGTTASPSNTGSPSPGNGASGPAPGTIAPAPPGTQSPAPGSGDPAPTPGTPGTVAPDPGPGIGTPSPDPGAAPGTPVPEPGTGAGPVDPAPGTSAPPPPPTPAPTETLVPGPASSTQPVAPASGAPSSSTAPTP